MLSVGSQVETEKKNDLSVQTPFSFPVAKDKDGEVYSESVIRGCGRSDQLSADGDTDACNTVILRWWGYT